MVMLTAVILAWQGWGAPEAEWRQAVGPWKWKFPRDHGSHREFRTEWWYFTGNLVDRASKQYGYQLTFFRQGISFQPGDPRNPWSLRDLYLAHFALTDVSASRFFHAESLSRKGPHLAGAAEDRMAVWLLNWSARMNDRRILVEARRESMSLSLNLTPRKPLVFHGEKGLSKKGPKRGQASYYISYTDLQTEGTIRTSVSEPPIRVQGTSWFDHEFGSNQLAQNQIGWDWFSLHLSDGHDLMIYLLRRKDGTLEPASSGTLVDELGRTTRLELSDIGIEVMSHWQSEKSGATYPSQWRIAIHPANIKLVVSPRLANQELLTGESTGVTYWEGAIEGSGTSGGKQVTSQGYIELVGYAGGVGAIF
jgi:predicted secreted hydrolase